jgi:hypothetical protein
MRTLAEFTKTTLIGGVLIILPIYLAALLLAKTVKGILELLSPVTSQIPAAVEFRQVLAIALLVAVCFIVGLIVRTGPGLRAKNAFERSVLEKLPGYTCAPPSGRSIDRRLLHGPGSVGADANGRQHLHLAARPGPSRGYPAYQSDRRIHEVGYRRRRVRASDEITDWPSCRTVRAMDVF